MDEETKEAQARKLWGRAEVRVAAAYLLFGSLWILLSDRLLFSLVSSKAAQQSIAIYKGWAFVAASALLFYLLLGAEVRSVRAAEARLRALNESLEAKVRERTAQLDASNRELEDLYNNAPCGYHSLEKDGTVIRMNDTELRWLGYPRGSVIGRMKLPDLLTGEGKETFRQNFPRFLAGGEIRDIELEFRKADGGTFCGLLSATAVRDGGGALVRSRSVVFDVTELKRTREELARYARGLEAANGELEAFSYSVSHDLRAPLRSIEGFVKILEEDYGPKFDDEGRRLLGVVRAGTLKMTRLIEDLLSFARVARKELASAPVDMDALVREAWKEAAPEGWPGRLEIGALPPAAGDPGLLRQVWVNLLSNAVKFTAKSPSPRVRVSGSAGPLNEYAVSDNGAGFEPAAAGRLFGIFQRLHQDAEFGGTGVGLAIVRRIVTRHGGAVRGEGRPGEGASFAFTLPPAKEAR